MAGAVVVAELALTHKGNSAGAASAQGWRGMPGKIPRLRYHAVSIVAGASACAAARQLKGIRVLSADAPRLPLATCEFSGTCKCTYRHHDDRRAGPRRAREAGELGTPWAMTDRRRSVGRRETD